MIETAADLNARRERRISGRAVVVAMFVFGALVTSLMFLYWTLHTAPFRPLQKALAEKFPHSVPRVDGGQHQMRGGSPRILRVVMRVEFDPIADEPRGERTLDQVAELAGHYLDLGRYDTLQLFLYHGVPEKVLQQKEFDRNLRPTGG